MQAHNRSWSAVLVCMVVAASVAEAQVPAGSEFRVNTWTTYEQREPAVAVDGSGNFVVVWQSQFQESNWGVFGQRYAASGLPLGAEFLANTATFNDQNRADVTAGAGGSFVVTWQAGGGQDGENYGIFAQRHAASGTRVGGEFQVNTFTRYAQNFPAAAADAAGNFVVTWNGNGQDGSNYGVFAQRYDAAGAPRGAEFRVNTFTSSAQTLPAVASDPAGNTVIVWQSLFQDGDLQGIFAQRYGPDGSPVGGEFQVNTFTTGGQIGPPAVASDGNGNFVVAWTSYNQTGGNQGDVFAQRFSASGTPLGSEFRVNTVTTTAQRSPSVASDASGNFVVVWQSLIQDGSNLGVFGQRYEASGAPRGGEFLVNATTSGYQAQPDIASDASGNFVVAWTGQDADSYGVFAQRFGGLVPTAVAVDTAANGILEPGESADVRPSWKNISGAAQGFGGAAVSFTGPAGAIYGIIDGVGSYGNVPDGATAQCTGCYAVSVSSPTVRPALHWDAVFQERVTPDAMGQDKPWRLHIGDSFTDVPRANPFYRFVETILHHRVTAGCSATGYCPSNATAREQMAVFVLVGKEGAGYSPPACGSPVFPDVPASSPFCRWVEELARRGVVNGCGGGNYCPGSPVTREQMAVFVLRTLDPALDPPACTTPMFSDVPASSTFCRWIEELARRGVVNGCGGGNYCPAASVSRDQMGVFIAVTFGLTLYGP